MNLHIHGENPKLGGGQPFPPHLELLLSVLAEEKKSVPCCGREKRMMEPVL